MMDGPENKTASTEVITVYNNNLQEENESSETDEVDNEVPTTSMSNNEQDEDWEVIPKDPALVAKKRQLKRLKKKFKSDVEILKQEINRKDEVIKEKENELLKLKCLEQENIQLTKKAERLDSLEANYVEMEEENKHQMHLIEQYKTDNEKHKSFEHDIKRLQSLEEDNRQHKKSVTELKQHLEKAKETETKLHTNINSISRENKILHGQIQTACQHNKKLEEEKKELIIRLSKLAGARMTVDNPNIADLSDSKRPTKLAEEFAQLYDDEWTDAFEDIEIENEQEKTAFMLKLLQDSNEICTNVSREHMARIKESLCTLNISPSICTQVLSPTEVEDKSQTSQGCDLEPATIEVDFKSLPTDQIQTVIELKRSMESRLLNQFEMKATDWIARVNGIDREKQVCIMKYIRKSVDICWAMCQHVPPVTLSFDDIHNGSLCFNTDMYRSYTKSGKYMDFIVWPALLLHEGGPLLSKGVAQGRH